MSPPSRKRRPRSAGGASRRAPGPRLFLTPGEPAGIGPDLAVMVARRPLGAQLVAVADPELLRERARRLRHRLRVVPFDPGLPRRHRPGVLPVVAVPLAAPAQPGRLDPANAGYVLETLRQAVALCREQQAAALVTGPVHKGVINDAHPPFTGHTEFLAQLTGSPTPVMLLVAGHLRVALATTHLPLREVPGALSTEGLAATLRVLAQDLRTRLGISRPRILVAGLNPHAGEQGHLGREEIEVIAPAVAAARREGLAVEGPLPADTLFIPGVRTGADAILAMYHDQGLPALKGAGFGEAVNVTLGLPIVRTSVDHGTALELAGTGRAHAGSLRAALALAARLAGRRPPA